LAESSLFDCCTRCLISPNANANANSQWRLIRLLTPDCSFGAAADASYVFKHALVQDAAFQTLLLTTRKEYHGGIARALETGFPETDRCSTAVAGAALRASGAVGVRAAILAQGRCIRAVASRQP
jgi:predicted ATPase